MPRRTTARATPRSNLPPRGLPTRIATTASVIAGGTAIIIERIGKRRDSHRRHEGVVRTSTNPGAQADPLTAPRPRRPRRAHTPWSVRPASASARPLSATCPGATGRRGEGTVDAVAVAGVAADSATSAIDTRHCHARIRRLYPGCQAAPRQPCAAGSVIVVLAASAGTWAARRRACALSRKGPALWNTRVPRRVVRRCSGSGPLRARAVPRARMVRGERARRSVKVRRLPAGRVRRTVMPP
jgi:hypothetical protein